MCGSCAMPSVRPAAPGRSAWRRRPLADTTKRPGFPRGLEQGVNGEAVIGDAGKVVERQTAGCGLDLAIDRTPSMDLGGLVTCPWRTAKSRRPNPRAAAKIP